MFVDEELVDVEIYYNKVGNFSFNVLSRREHERLKEEDKSKYSVLHCKMKKMTWGLYNDIQESSYEEVQGPMKSEQRFNFALYKQHKIQKLLVDWDAKIKNDNGLQVKAPISLSMIKKMGFEIVEKLLRVYDEDSFMTEEEEKK
jgi:hypothetical protein